MLFSEIYTSIRKRKQKHAVNQYHNYIRYLEEQHVADQKAVEQNYTDDAEKENRKRQLHDKWLAWASLLVNVVMIIAKLIASYLSHSISIVSALVDSAMDITSGVVVYICVRLIQKTNRYEYPIGRNRLEPVSILIVSVIMIMANLVVVLETAISIIEDTIDPYVTLIVVCVMATGTCIKLVLLIFCRKYDSPNSRVLALDQRNDIVTNIVALVGAFVGHRWWKYADPIGAFLVCSFIAISWLKSARLQIPLLVGKAAKPEFISRITKIAINHDPRIQSIETLTVYHLGANFLVELHVIMSADMMLQEAHDISSSLQLKLEKLPYVERVFVHCDYGNEDVEHLNSYNK